MKHYKLQTLGVLSLFILLGALISITPNRAVHDAELRYVETSNNMSLAGGVMPASCQSYPGDGYPEHYPQHYINDTNGYCTGSCPSGMTDALTPYIKCNYPYTQYPSQSDDIAHDGIYSVVIPPNGTCPAIGPHDITNYRPELLSVSPAVPIPNYMVRVCVPIEAKTCLQFTSGCACTNGALSTSFPGCNVCPVGSIMNTISNTCAPCGYDGCSGTPPRCLNGSQNVPNCYSDCRYREYWDDQQGKCVFDPEPINNCGSNVNCYER